MRIRVGISRIAGIGVLLLTAMAGGPVGAQNQTPANAPPPAGWKDPNTGLIWALKDNGSDTNQTDALNYCRNLSLGGLRDWRLPEIDELAQIYDASVVSGKWSLINGDSFDLHLKGGIQMTACCSWSATGGNRSGEAWFFGFFLGHRSSTDVGYSGNSRALCVRRPGE